MCFGIVLIVYYIGGSVEVIFICYTIFLHMTNPFIIFIVIVFIYLYLIFFNQGRSD